METDVKLTRASNHGTNAVRGMRVVFSLNECCRNQVFSSSPSSSDDSIDFRERNRGDEDCCAGNKVLRGEDSDSESSWVEHEDQLASSGVVMEAVAGVVTNRTGGWCHLLLYGIISGVDAALEVRKVEDDDADLLAVRVGFVAVKGLAIV